MTGSSGNSLAGLFVRNFFLLTIEKVLNNRHDRRLFIFVQSPRENHLVTEIDALNNKSFFYFRLFYFVPFLNSSFSSLQFHFCSSNRLLLTPKHTNFECSLYESVPNSSIQLKSSIWNRIFRHFAILSSNYCFSNLRLKFARIPVSPLFLEKLWNVSANF